MGTVLFGETVAVDQQGVTACSSSSARCAWRRSSSRRHRSGATPVDERGQLFLRLPADSTGTFRGHWPLVTADANRRDATRDAIADAKASKRSRRVISSSVHQDAGLRDPVVLVFAALRRVYHPDGRRSSKQGLRAGFGELLRRRRDRQAAALDCRAAARAPPGAFRTRPRAPRGDVVDVLRAERPAPQAIAVRAFTSITRPARVRRRRARRSSGAASRRAPHGRDHRRRDDHGLVEVPRRSPCSSTRRRRSPLASLASVFATGAVQQEQQPTRAGRRAHRIADLRQARPLVARQLHPPVWACSNARYDSLS